MGPKSLDCLRENNAAFPSELSLFFLRMEPLEEKAAPVCISMLCHLIHIRECMIVAEGTDLVTVWRKFQTEA